MEESQENPAELKDMIANLLGYQPLALPLN